MHTLPVHLFKSSFGPFLDFLNDHGLKYEVRAVGSGVPMASGGTLGAGTRKGNWRCGFLAGSCGSCFRALNRGNGRKVIITTKDRTVAHAEGLSMSELENGTAIDPNPTEDVAGERAETGHSPCPR